MDDVNKERDAKTPDGLDEVLRQMDEALPSNAGDSSPIHEDPLFIREKMKVDFLEEVLQAMEDQKISAAELARRMGVTRSRVTKILNETSNFQMETMAKIAAALRLQVTIRLYSQEETIEKRSLNKVSTSHLGTYGKALSRQKPAKNRKKSGRKKPVKMKG